MWKKSSVSRPSATSDTVLVPFISWPMGIRKPSTNTACAAVRQRSRCGEPSPSAPRRTVTGRQWPFAARAGAFEGEALDGPDRRRAGEAGRHMIANGQRLEGPIAVGGANAGALHEAGHAAARASTGTAAAQKHHPCAAGCLGATEVAARAPIVTPAASSRLRRERASFESGLPALNRNRPNRAQVAGPSRL